MQILDRYVTSAPSVQNALDIFSGEWASKLPGYLQSIEAGQIRLFQDPRIQWAVEKFGGIQGDRVLELGPLEAGHTYMLEKLGAASIIAVEANTRAYLKCLIVKEIMGLTRTHFLCGDFVEYLRNSPDKFDVCFASGVLYHMLNPVELLTLMAEVSDKIFIWTHYYDAEIIHRNAIVAPKFTDSIAADHNGFKHTLYRYEYATALDSPGFCGGSNPFSYWMNREELLSCLGYVGLTNIDIKFELPDHPNGPCLALTAIRPREKSYFQAKLSEQVSTETKLDKLGWQLQQAKLEMQRCFQQAALTLTQLQQTKTELEQTQSQLLQIQTEQIKTLAELDKTQTQLHLCKTEQVKTIAEWDKTQAQLHVCQEELGKVQA